MQTPRDNLDRLANYLQLNVQADWSHKHLANLIYWRITRDVNKNRH
jgi:hypothetical protein